MGLSIGDWTLAGLGFLISLYSRLVRLDTGIYLSLGLLFGLEILSVYRMFVYYYCYIPYLILLVVCLPILSYTLVYPILLLFFVLYCVFLFSRGANRFWLELTFKGTLLIVLHLIELISIGRAARVP